MLRKSVVGLVALMILGIVGWVSLVVALEAYGHRQALAFAREAQAAGTSEATAKLLTAKVYESFIGTDPDAPPLLLRLRRFLSHPLLPDLLSVDEGAIEAIYLEGHCDSASRSLVYVLGAIGIEAIPVYLLGPMGEAHTVVEATLPGGKLVMLDPFFGLVPEHQGGLLAGSEAQTVLREGTAPQEIWQPVSPRAHYSIFFDTFETFSLTDQGADFEWRRHLDLGVVDTLQIGAFDGSSKEVPEAAGALSLGAHWHYLGHRYERGWTRTLVADHAMRVTFHVLEHPRAGVLTSDLEPEIQPGKVIYTLGKGDALSFVDRRATRSIRTLRSYIGVDAITVERLRSK